jgi:hypothetical protein
MKIITDPAEAIKLVLDAAGPYIYGNNTALTAKMESKHQLNMWWQNDVQKKK